MARLRLLEYRWPRHVRVFTVVSALAGVVALAVFAFLGADQEPICAGVQMRPGDECDINGSMVSYSNMEDSPFSALIFAAAVVLLVRLVTYVRKERKPTEDDIFLFERYVKRRRRELREIYDSSPGYRETWASPDELLAQFDKRAERVRRRKGFSASQQKT